jgi:hypothetical protein
LRVLTLQGGAVFNSRCSRRLITYEDGSSARFSELDSAEQAEISSLVSESVPSIEKYNLDEDEVNLLNTLRDSMTSEEFINSLVDYRMQAVSAQRELSTTDYDSI